MSSAYFAPLVLLPTIIIAPGRYKTRRGDTVAISHASKRHDFGCAGTYADGVREAWHRSGRLLAARETPNDIVSPA